MTRLTRAELVDLVRRLVGSLGDGGLSRTLCIEAERVLKAEEAHEASLWRQSDEGCKTRDEDGCSLTVYPQSDRWCWTAIRSTTDWYKETTGWSFTEKDAQAAALTAAKEMADDE